MAKHKKDNTHRFNDVQDDTAQAMLLQLRALLVKLTEHGECETIAIAVAEINAHDAQYQLQIHLRNKKDNKYLDKGVYVVKQKTKKS